LHVLLLPDRLPEAGSTGEPMGNEKARLMGRADRKYRLTKRNAGI
jgi:hypothetical protein